MINKLSAIWREVTLAVDELRVRYIVEDKVEWNVQTLKDCNEFIFVSWGKLVGRARELIRLVVYSSHNLVSWTQN